MEDQMLLVVLAALTGLGLLIAGLFQRARASSFSSLPRRAPGEVRNGERAVVGGSAASPVQLSSPVTGTPCVFYLERVEKMDPSGETGGVSSSRNWSIVAVNPYGCFYVRDGGGSALVFPTYRSLSLARPEIEDGADLLAVPGTVRRFENLIEADGPLTVIGTPRPLSDLMAWLRSGVDVKLPADAVERLAAMERDPAACATPCFFGDGVEAVADRGPEEFLAGRASSSAIMIQLGALLLAGAIAAAVYVLKFNADLPQP